ncbi:MAG: GDYXXLXY domain-containing protein [Flavobacteriaceae bacterium]|jgi:uncharacterized membrane-anchored protein|nr:GDYXXLXY domain-containing protein [Flavobacteriaceae bacterium]
MKKVKRVIIFLNLIGLLLFFNFAVIQKENLLEEGQLILLELAPVDPRSLMQGDYMRLNYAISRNTSSSRDKLPKRGYCVVFLDSSKIAHLVRFQEKAIPLKENEILIKYYSEGGWNINIGAESYFFQEGNADKYDKAKYGGIKVDKEGNSLLIGLYDEDIKLIQ